MYLTDFRENTLQDVITKLEPDLFSAVTGLTVDDFNLLVSLNVFNTEHMNQAVFAFRRYEDLPLLHRHRLVARDKASLDITWLRDDSLEDTENLPSPDVIAREIVEDLEAALAEFTNGRRVARKGRRRVSDIKFFRVHHRNVQEFIRLLRCGGKEPQTLMEKPPRDVPRRPVS